MDDHAKDQTKEHQSPIEPTTPAPAKEPQTLSAPAKTEPAKDKLYSDWAIL